jgi:hypothetical protein
MKFPRKSSTGNRADTCGQTDKQLIGAFRDYANAPTLTKRGVAGQPAVLRFSGIIYFGAQQSWSGSAPGVVI